VNYQPSADPNKVVESIKNILSARHGREDYTVITQEQALEVMNSVLGVLTLRWQQSGQFHCWWAAWDSDHHDHGGDRTHRRDRFAAALGARQHQVLMLFLGEAILLSAAGGLAACFSAWARRKHCTH